MASPTPPPIKLSRPVTLKLKTPGTPSSIAMPPPLMAPITGTPAVQTPSAMASAPATPSAGGGTKIILKRSQPPTPAAAPEGISAYPGVASTMPLALTQTPGSGSISAATPTVTMTQKGRVSKPTAKKRARDFVDGSDDDGRPTVGRGGAGGPPKRPKLILKKTLGNKGRTASIVLKQVHKESPPHSKGEGYDSEEEDREMDPLIEEEFVLRMLPGEHCDYLRRMVDERLIGVPVKDGGADFQMKWLAGVERRALVTVRGTMFVGVLVDLPTITEGMKTWDKRNFMKSADICQMLLVFSRVADEATAKSLPLPTMVAKDFRWPHGLTPPMHDCIHRRFRKRLSKKEIKDKEAELQRLLHEDRVAIDTKWELIDDGRAATATTATGDGRARYGDEAGGGDDDDDEEEVEGMELEDGDEADAYGEADVDYFSQQRFAGQAGKEDEPDAPDIDDAELEAMFMEDDDDEDEGAKATGAAPSEAASNGGGPSAPAVASAAAGGAAADEADADADADGDEEEDDDDDDGEEILDEDELAEADHVKGVHEDINELKKQLQTLDNTLATTQNMLLRKRIEENKKRVMSELLLKKASIGEVDEEE